VVFPAVLPYEAASHCEPGDLTWGRILFLLAAVAVLLLTGSQPSGEHAHRSRQDSQSKPWIYFPIE